MSWMFKRDSPLRSSLRKYSFTLPPKLPEGACLEVFRTHWQQAYSIIERNSGSWQQYLPTADDVTSVINNLDQMITLLLQEAQQSTACLTNGSSQVDPEPTGPLLSFLLMEGCLDKLFTWSVRTGEFVNILKLEQLKFYEILVTNCHQDLLFHKPVVRPLLRLLASCGDCVPVEVEKRLIILLNTLCVCLTQFPDLLQVFFGASSDHGSTRFLIFSLLIPFVHREGAIGQQARDALLLCMALSRRNESIGVYIAEHSNFCPVLATGLSGLYSLLPRKLPNVPEDWHQFTPEDISEIPELAMFLNSLEFCNAVIQVAHPLVQEQLMEYLYQGFLVPVLGPALHQEAVAVPVARLENTTKYLNTVEEIVATTAYLELFLRTITEPILQQMFLKFILTSSYDTHRVLNSLIDRLGAQSRLCLVTMALFRCMLDLNCEDVLFELVFRYLIPCTHVMVSQRSRVRDTDMYNQAAEKFLSLIPSSSVLHSNDYSSSLPTSQSTPLSSIPGFDSLQNLPPMSRGGSLRIKRHQRSPSTNSLAFGELDRLQSKHAVNGTEWYVNIPDAHPSSYMDYLREAHRNVKSCTLACRCWSATYDGLDPPPNAVIVSESKESEAFTSSDSSDRLKLSNTYVDNEQKKQLDATPLLQKANTSNCNSENSVLELSSENLAVLQDSFKQNQQDRQVTSERVLEKDNFVIKTLNKHNEFISSDILQQIVNAEDEKVFWSLVCSTETPSSIGSVDDSLQTIDGYFNDLEVDTSVEDKLQVGYTEVMDSKDECSNADSGVFESRDSCISEKDSDVVPHSLLSAKSSEHKDNLFISIPSYSSKSDLKPCSSSVSETSTKSSNSPASPGSWESFGTPNIGPFLSIILTRLEMMMQNDVYTNLHLTGIISRLACYPQALLRSFLLNPSLVFQPTVRSLFQVLGSLKQKVDSYSYTVDNYEELVHQSKQFLFSRVQNMAKPFTTRVYSDSVSRVHSASFSGFQRGEPRRRSLTSFLFRKSSFLRNRDNFSKEPMLESISDGQGYRYVSKPTPYSLEGEMESVKAKNAIFCAVVLEEFLKELAAIAQEHSIIQLNPDFWDDIDTPWE
ncbi:FHF complex subunit HOOK-interacting protein 1B-like isoform X2 [Argiope bruennichi]|uniref:FHF complex subunit HOOK-interacting protein 1B-like isoform X2 n=1 Tax=Argiope bruennichi TaxID=94029 RepID=UPI002494FD92|nr:FHF complex subunit HOOK-interacting protein 1B-like isoform X2 [Argiope bruennichi]